MAEQNRAQMEEELNRLEMEEELSRLESEEAADRLPSSNKEMGLAESTTRMARSALKGATFGASELPMGGVTALSQTVADLIDSGKMESAQTLVEHIRRNYEADWRRQNKYENENPQTALTAELIGGLAGAGPIKGAGTAIKEGLEGVAKEVPWGKVVSESASKIARATPSGQLAASAPELKTAGDIILESGKTAAGASVAMKAGDQAARAPFEGQKASDQLLDAGIAGVVGAGTGMGLTTGIGIGASAASDLADLIKPTLGKLGTSRPALKMVQVLTGRPVEVQKRFMELEKEIENLPSTESVVSFFNLIRDEVKLDDERWARALPEVQERVNFINNKIEALENTTRGEFKDKLIETKTQLMRLEDDIKNAMREQRPAKTQAEKVAKDKLKEPSMGAFVEIGQLARKTLQQKLIEGSAEATKLIEPDYRLNRDVVVDIIRRVRKDLFPKPTLPHQVEGANALRTFSDNIEAKYGKQLTGTQIKQLLKELDTATEYVAPGGFTPAQDRALQAIRKALDGELKSYNTDYAKMMEEKVQPIAKAYELASDHLSSPERIQIIFKRAADNQHYEDILKQIGEVSGINVLHPSELIRSHRKMVLEGEQSIIESLPEVKVLRDSERLLQMTTDSNFERAVFETIADQETAQKIINLRKDILRLSDKKYVENEVAAATMGLPVYKNITEKELVTATNKREAALERARKIAGYEKGEQAIQKILRAPQNDAESVSATKLINAISELPEEQFGEIFRLINMSDPSKFGDLVQAMRVKSAMDKSITQGSKRVNMFSVMGAAVGSLLSLSKFPAVNAAIGAFGGAYIDEFGGRVTQAYLRNMARMKGLPTYTKMIEMSPMPYTSGLTNLMSARIAEMALEIRDAEKIHVHQANQSSVADDIKKSSLNSVERAKAEQQLYRMGYIEGKTAKSLMLEGIPKKEGKGAVGAKLVPQMTEPKKAPDLKADKPDILERIKRKAYSGQR